jgi:hypothetical protein
MILDKRGLSTFECGHAFADLSDNRIAQQTGAEIIRVRDNSESC